MSYAAQPPVGAAPRRPATVTLAAFLLGAMPVVGVAYAVVTLSITPGVLDRFRSAAVGFGPADAQGLVTLVWLVAGIAVVLAVILFALYTVLALGLRRGSNTSRVATWVVCALGLLAGCGSAVTVFAQRGGWPQSPPRTFQELDTRGVALGAVLTDAYPNGWMSLNVA